MERLPYIDDHRRRVGAPADRAWAALEDVVGGYLRSRLPRLVVRAWGLQPSAGFEIAESEPPRRLVLRGRHNFARYELAFDLEPDGNDTNVTATTHAVFPGPHGRVYRALVIGTRLHVLATRRVLRQVASAAAKR